jgi:hypothetical protein
MICATCGADPCADPNFCALCRDADRRKAKGQLRQVLIVETPPEDLARLRRLMNDDVLLVRAWAALNDPRNRPTPKATIEAVMHAVREHGLSALKEPATVQRLERCDAAARDEINQRIEKLGLKHAS